MSLINWIKSLFGSEPNVQTSHTEQAHKEQKLAHQPKPHPSSREHVATKHATPTTPIPSSKNENRSSDHFLQMTMINNLNNSILDSVDDAPTKNESPTIRQLVINKEDM
ncbi:hypothetical protein PP175_27360 (plasmid) [Aneurinibacillus sp. Ricciae_BoGa-3]|uniref:hypothetical protein n=1 Tax=Aneurinibacillus sp. Ricciae_BoGa-3 TaxID=3022697 RepID=UPI002341515F|nr:hypothetical protein [Aneurinibacillus sp. Ricciae_BoGa-3]WCK56934.1 hypothetical protein PP175_27475 [Aneurinibacillus sp. Ricciae_BoGa-3]WCK57757.1 hypothetical protein PP175_27360 [Aneurinibacillus sp. Ricciae_BoGa-3]